MGKITVQQKKNKLIITNQLVPPETLNEKTYKAVSSGLFDNFLPMEVKQHRKQISLICVVENLIPLTQYFSEQVSKDKFLTVVHKLALIIKECERNMINADNIDIQLDRIFIDAQSGMVKCIYWPVMGNQHSVPVYYFFKQLPYDVSFSPNVGSAFFRQYMRFFDETRVFSIDKFDQYVMSLSRNKSTPNPNPNPGPAPMPSVAQMPAPAQMPAKSNNLATVSCPFCTTENKQGALYCCVCGCSLEQAVKQDIGGDSPTGGTTLLNNKTAGTVVLDLDRPSKPSYPYLIREKTQEKIVINKPTFRIGSEKQYCDYFVFDNTYISRSHADIVTRGSSYYVVDRNSTNKTFVDGRVISPEAEIEIFHKTQLRFADEDFTFYIE